MIRAAVPVVAASAVSAANRVWQHPELCRLIYDFDPTYRVIYRLCACEASYRATTRKYTRIVRELAETYLPITWEIQWYRFNHHDYDETDWVQGKFFMSQIAAVYRNFEVIFYDIEYDTREQKMVCQWHVYDHIHPPGPPDSDVFGPML
jgi:hypothetical protein